MAKKKTVWADIYKEFKRAYPNRAKGALGFQPYGFGSILVYFSDNKRMIYDQVNCTLDEFVAE